jgi:Cdc6-like AAA superfamily ATPase
MDGVSIASSVAGLVAIADNTFSRIYSFYKYAKAVKGAAKEIEELAAGIRTLSELLHGLQLLLSQFEDDLPDPNLRMHHINSCRQTLSKIQQKVDSHDPHDTDTSLEKTIRKLKWPFSTSETKELLAEVDRHKATINVAMTGDSLASILRGLTRQDQMAEDIKNLKAAQEERWAMETHISINIQRKKVLSFFGNVDPALRHHTNLKLHHPLTGLWLTEGDSFKTWLQNRNSKMWLSGIPGAGKTVLAACVIEETLKESKKSNAVAYFYCDYKDISTQDPVWILGSIAAQLARQDEKAFMHLEELFNSIHSENGGHGNLEASELVKVVVQQTSTFEDVSIIVDGLDECGARAAEAVSSLLHLCSDTDSNVRAIFLSRDEYEIRELLSEAFFHVNIAAQSEDLKLYVAAQIDSRERLVGRGQLRIRSKDLKQHIITKLVDGAQGM